MLDIRYIRENAELVQKKAEQKGYKVDVKSLLKLDDARRDLTTSLESNQQLRNEHTAKTKGKKPSPEEIAEGKRIREKIEGIQKELDKANEKYGPMVESVPNIFPDDTPLGGEEANKEIKTWGKAEKSDFVGQ